MASGVRFPPAAPMAKKQKNKLAFVFITGNKNKVLEARQILKNFEIKQRTLNLSEIQSLKVEEVVKEKAKEAFKIVKKPVLVEDTSLEIKAWNNFPGALIKFLLESVGAQGIIKMLSGEKNRFAVAKTALGLYDGKNLKVFVGKIEGTISKKVSGERGFGWDSIFIPQGFKKTFAQMNSKEKSSLSMRRKALEKMEEYLIKSKKNTLKN